MALHWEGLRSTGLSPLVLDCIGFVFLIHCFQTKPMFTPPSPPTCESMKELVKRRRKLEQTQETKCQVKVSTTCKKKPELSSEDPGKAWAALQTMLQLISSFTQC